MSKLAVLREDVVQIKFEIEENPFADLLREIEELKAALSASSSDLDELRDNLRRTGSDSDSTSDNFDDLNRILRNMNSNNLNNLEDDIRDSNNEAKKSAGIFNKFAKSLGNVAKQAGAKTWSGIKTGIKGIATSIGVVSTGLSAVMGFSVKTGMEFEASMSQVAATMGMTADEANYNNEVYAMLANRAKEMGATTKFSASESADALNYLALAGYTAEQAYDALPTILNLATAGGMDLAAASDMVTDAMSALGKEISQENLTQFGDRMAKAAQKSNTSVQQLGEAILTVGGTASDLAGDTVELNTALGILADSGIKGSEGGTHLRNMILSLQQARNSDAAKIFKNMGLSVYDAEGKMRSLGDVFGDLNKQLKGASAEKVNSTLSTIFKQTDLASARAMLAATADSVDGLESIMNAALEDSNTSIAALNINLKDMSANFDTNTTQEQFAAQMLSEFGMNAEQAGILYTGLMSVTDGTARRWDELSGYIANSDGAMQDMADTMSDNLSGRVTEFKSAMEGAGIAIYEAIGSSNLKDLVKEASGWISELTETTEKEGLKGLTKAIPKVFSKITAKISELAPNLIDMAVDLIDNLIIAAEQSEGSIMSSIEKIGASLFNGFLRLVPKVLNSGLRLFTSFLQGLSQKIPDLIPMALDATQTLITSFTTYAPYLLQAGKEVIDTLISSLVEHIPEILTTGLELILGLVQGILSPESITYVLNAALQLITALVNGILDNLGLIVQAAGDLIIGLIEGLVSNIPAIINTAVTLLSNFVISIIENLPYIIETGIEIVVSLALGLIQGIPEILAAIPEFVEALIEGLMSVDWAEVGWGILKGIANGFKKGFSSILGKEENQNNLVHNLIDTKGGAKEIGAAATYMTNTAVSGFSVMEQNMTMIGNQAMMNLTNSIYDNQGIVTNAANQINTEFAASLNKNTEFYPTVQMSDYIVQIPDYTSQVLSDIENNTNKVTTATNQLSSETLSSFSNLKDTKGIGEEAVYNLGLGITTGAGNVITATDTISDELMTSVTRLGAVSLNSDVFQFHDYTNGLENIVNTTESSLSSIPNTFQDTFLQSTNNMNVQLDGMQDNLNNRYEKMKEETRAFSNEITNIFNHINLYQTGKNIANGLNQGMLSMANTITQTAQNLANSVSNTINQALDIHSPSKVTEQSGEFTVLGFEKGIKNMQNKALLAARDMSVEVATTITPTHATYTPENTTISNSRNMNQVNHYNSNFHLTLNGASATDSNERKVKRWIREGIKEANESFTRRNPRIQEV